MIHPLRAIASLALGLLIAACGGNPTIPDSPPEAPGSLSAELTPNNDALLQWTAPESSSDRAPVTGYRVYLESSDGLISALGDTRSLSYRHTGLLPGTRYVFHVRAQSEAGPSEPSASAFVDVPPELLPPATPGSLAAELTPNNEALLQWTAPAPSPDRAPVTDYRVYLESSDGLISALGDTRSLSYRHTGLLSGIRYVFHVRAQSEAGPSEPSASAFVDVPPELLHPQAPGSLTAALTPDNEALLGWTAPASSPDRAPVAGYRVYLESSDGLISELGDTRSLSYRHTGLSPGTRYVFHVRALSEAGRSEPSASAFVDVPPELLPPAAPGSLAAELTPNNEALLTWEAPAPSPDRAPVTGYRVYLESSDGLISELGDTRSLSYRHTGLSPGTRYVFHVQALSEAGRSEPSASAFVDVLPELLPPAAPGSLTTELTRTNGALLTWEAPAPSDDRAPVTGYLVYLDSAGGLAAHIGTTQSLSYRHVGLLAGRTYVYHVRAHSQAGASLPSASAPVEVPGLPIAPIAIPHVTVRADLTDRRVVVSWVHRLEPTLSTVVTGFELQYCEVASDYQSDHCPYSNWLPLPEPGVIFPSTQREYRDPAFNFSSCDGTNARMYRMRAIAGDDPSASSRYSVPTRPICPSADYSPPRRVEALFAETMRDNRVNICWDAPPDYTPLDHSDDVIGYEIQLTTDKDLPVVEDDWLVLDAHVSPNETMRDGSPVDEPPVCRLYSGLADGDERWFRVRAYNSAGHGHWSAPYHYVHGFDTYVPLLRRASAQNDATLVVADARADEGPGATLAFAVTLSRAVSRTVTVDYATADGTATAHQDYEPLSGALVFAPGERQKTVHVTVLDDAHDEGEETLALSLSNASGAVVADAEATGTIVNSDPLPKAWLSRFGRAIGSQVLEAVSDRLAGTPGRHVTLGGMQLDASGNPEALAASGWRDTEPTWKREVTRSMTTRDLLLGSAFHLSSGQDGGPALSAWGRIETGGVKGEKDATRLEGDMTTGLLGFDVEADRMLAGVSISMSKGSGGYQPTSENGPAQRRGDIESSLTGMYPYASLRVSERLSLWGLVGYGAGELTLTPEGSRPIETDIELRLGGLGLRGILLDEAQSNGVQLTVKSDAMWLRTQSDAVEGMEGTEADVNRLRLALEGSRAMALAGGATLTPSAELGIRHDGGDAETGTGLEAGAAVRFAAGAFSIEGAVRGVLAHQQSGYEEWGASGSIRLDPGISGRGLSLTLAPAWGNASNGASRLWSTRYASETLAHDAASEEELHLDAEVGYGLRAPVGVMTPYTALSLWDGGARTVRLGTRWNISADATLSAEASHLMEHADEAPADTLMLRGSVRW